MERNWLIRTSQNQVLGPVAKQKLLEFIQKGALGLTDEVTSGNGYWFALKEKDLVEKYLYGDIPQSYNPISESRSVLSRRENPEKTSSINTAPANQASASASASVAPKAQDLELPDITVVKNISELKMTPVVDDSKLPKSEDLEFPDVEKISSSVNDNFKEGNLNAPAAPSPAPVMQASHQAHPIHQEEEKVVLPDDNDLAFPDMTDMTSPKVDKGKVDLSHNYTRTVALDEKQASEVLPENSEAKGLQEIDQDSNQEFLSLEDDKEEGSEQNVNIPPAKKARPPLEERKLLHDRKTKSSVMVAGVSKASALRDPSRENYPKEASSGALKKRNDNYIFFILVILALIILAIFFYFKEILNKPLPV